MDQIEAQPGVDLEGPVVLFDGVCNLCNGFVQFVIENDPDGSVSFASLQSDIGSQILRHFGLPGDKQDSIVLVENGRYYERSDAALRIAGHLEGVYSYATVFLYLPRFIRDRAYAAVANNRYTIFGKRDRCMMPTEDRQARFLSDPNS